MVNLMLFESSLWDLKPKRMVEIFDGMRVWKFPMGFETNVAGSGNDEVVVWKFPMGFETVLRMCDLLGQIVWKFPMGFETPNYPPKTSSSLWVWKSPMGFETQFVGSLKQQIDRFESSLWDLKQKPLR